MCHVGCKTLLTHSVNQLREVFFCLMLNMLIPRMNLNKYEKSVNWRICFAVNLYHKSQSDGYIPSLLVTIEFVNELQ